jgi:hypothetical protein
MEILEKNIIEVLEKSAGRRLFQMKTEKSTTPAVCCQVDYKTIWQAVPKKFDQLSGRESYLWGVVQRPEIRQKLDKKSNLDFSGNLDYCKNF